MSEQEDEEKPKDLDELIKEFATAESEEVKPLFGMVSEYWRVQSFFKRDNVFYRVRKGDPFLKLSQGFGSGEMAPFR